MFKAGLGRVFVLFMLVASVGFSVTAKDIFVSLDKSYADLGGGYAEFTLKSPATAATDGSKLNFYIQSNNTPTNSLRIYISKGGVWSPLGTENLVLNQAYKIRVEAVWKVPKPDKNGVTSVSRDWIPYINVAGTYYNMTSWAWWNVSYWNRINANITYTLSNTTDIQIPIVLNDTNWLDNACYNSECNDSAVTWLNASSGLEEQIPFYFERYNATGNSYLWIRSPMLNLSVNQFFIYFNSTSANTTLYNNGSKVFIKFYDFENGSDGDPFAGDFGGLSAGSTYLNSSAKWKGVNSVSLDDGGSGTQFVIGLGQITNNATLEYWTNCVASASSNAYWGGGTNGMWSSTRTYTTSFSFGAGGWKKVRWLLNGSTAAGNVTVDGTTYATATGSAGATGQVSFPYSATGGVCYVDEVYFGKYLNKNLLAYSFGGVETNPEADLNYVTPLYPNNAVTNYTNNIYFGYNASFNTGSIVNCSLYVNGSIAEANASQVANNSASSIYHHFANSGDYSWLVGCWNSTQQKNSSVRTLTLMEYVLNGSATAYELTRQPFNITFTFSNYSYSNVSLVYNGSYYPATDLGSNVWNASALVPIVQTNNTALVYYWSFTRTNSSISEVKLTPTATQNVSFAGLPVGTDASAYLLVEGSSETIYMFVANNTPLHTSTTVFITVDGVNRTATYLGYNNSVLNYSYTFNVGTIPTLNQSKNWTWYSRIYSDSLSRNSSSTTVNVTIYKVTVTDCSYGLASFAYFTYDEENGTYVNDSDYSLRVITRAGNITTTYSKSVIGQPNMTICLYPIWSNATADLSLIYSGQENATYSQRTYYNFGVVLTNVTQIQNVYLLNTSKSYLVNIETRDQYGSVAPNIVVYFERFNYTSNQFINMTNVYTTEGGTGLTYLIRYDVPYRIVLRDTNGNLLSQYDNYFISSSPITLRTVSEIVDVYQRFLGVTHSCDYNPTSKILICSYNDPNSILTRVEFKVTEVFNYVSTVVCAENKTAFSGEFTCDLSATDNASKGYYYEMNAYDPVDVEYFYPLERGNINRPSSSIFGANGVIFALFFFMTMFFMGIWKPVVAVMLGIASIFLSYLFGWLNLGTAPAFIFGTIIVLGLFIVWKMKDR